MSTTLPDRLRAPGLAALGLLLAGAITGCSPFGDDHSDPPPARVAPTVAHALDEALASRAAALRRGHRKAFLAGLDPAAGRSFLREQRGYFANLRQLPLARFSLRVEPRDVLRTRQGFWAVVEVRMQLDGYDAAASTEIDRYLFTPVPGTGRYRVASVTDAAWEERNDVDPPPWERGPIRVRTTRGVLGIFDEESVSGAAEVLAAMSRAVGQVAGAVPYAWPQAITVYAPSDSAFLDGLGDLPGDDPSALDAVAFPVRVAPGSAALAATRIVLAPDVLDAPEAIRDRLLRHEVTHVAVGVHDDHAPVWLSEGLAEYVAAQTLPPDARGVAPAAIAAAREAPTLPDDATFNDADSAAHYGLSWWVCEYVARNNGVDALWALLDRLNAAGAGSEDQPDGTPEEQETAIRSALGFGGAELARRGARLLLVTYGGEGG